MLIAGPCLLVPALVILPGYRIGARPRSACAAPIASELRKG